MTARVFFSTLFLIAGALFSFHQTSHAGERHYLLVFSYQSEPKRARYTHTFATFVKVGDGCVNGHPPVLGVYTISWLPQTLRIRPLACRSEPGINLTLEQTLDFSVANGFRISEWGPYEIEGEFYHYIYNEYLKIESGRYRYKGMDPFRRGAETTDCIHAVSDSDPRHSRFQYFWIRLGEKASAHLVYVLFDRERVLAHPDNLAWIDTALGLDRYPIVHRRDP